MEHVANVPGFAAPVTGPRSPDRVDADPCGEVDRRMTWKTLLAYISGGQGSILLACKLRAPGDKAAGYR